MTPALIWIIAGSVLCLMELVFPIAFVAMMMGISAIIVAGIALIIPNVAVQSVAWLLISVLLIAGSRRFVPKRINRLSLQDAVEAETLTAIAPGQSGRVLYEGNSWRAECQDASTAIAAMEKVYIVGRKGNTLIVYPLNEINHPPALGD